MSILQNWLAEVESWAGTPFVTEGCTKGVKGGTNCAHWFADSILKAIPGGEAIAVEALTWTHARYFVENINIIAQLLSQIAFVVPVEAIQPGDIILIKYRRVSSQPSVLLGDDVYVYCDPRMKQIVKRQLLPNYKDRIMYVFRLNKIAEEQQ